MKKLCLAALVALASASCSTYYGPRYEAARGPDDAGYYDVRLDDNRYRVQYRVDNESYGLAEDFAMRRAAELTLNQGYDWFQIVDRSRAIGDDMFRRYDSYRHHAREGDHSGYPPYGDGFDDSVAVLDIVMGYNPPPGGSNIYSASRVLAYHAGERRNRVPDRYDRGRY